MSFRDRRANALRCFVPVPSRYFPENLAFIKSSHWIHGRTGGKLYFEPGNILHRHAD